MSYLFMMKEYWKYSAGEHSKVIWIYFIYMVNCILDIYVPLIFAKILNTLQTAPKETMLKEVAFWFYVWITVTIIMSIIPRIARVMREMLAYKVKQNYINRHYHIVTNLPLKWHTDHHSGDTINRVTLAATSLYTFAVSQHVYVRFMIKIPGSILALLYLDVEPIIFVLTALMVIISMIAMKFFDKIMIVQFRKLNEINHKISATFYDFVSNIRTIITLKLGEKTKKDLNEKIKEGYETTVYVKATLDNIKFSTLFILVEIPKIGIVFYYIWQQFKNTGSVMAGSVAALFQYLTKIAEVFRELVTQAQKLVSYRTDLEAVTPITEAFCCGREYGHLKKKWMKVEVKGLNFSYNNQKKVIKDVNFEFKRGEKIAIIGESGSGKSTLMSVMRGLYEVDNGYLNVDDTFKKTDFMCLSKITTLMPQDPEIFENTIEYNITLGLDYPKKMVDKVVELACFDKVLKKLPFGMKTDIREKGVNLSGGEKQRLALARNLLAALDSDIIIMDEPTSSVDMENEAGIYKNIFEFYKDKTIISSVHKLYLLEMFDKIYKMEGGCLSKV